MQKNNNQLPGNKVDASNFTVPEGEEHLYHVKIEVPQYDQSTGEKLSTPRIQAFTHKMFRSSLMKSLKQLGFKLEILHDPTEYLKSRKKTKAATTEERIREKVLEDLRRGGFIKDPNQKTEDEIRAEVLEDLRAKGMLKEPKKTGSRNTSTSAPTDPEKPENPANETPAQGEGEGEGPDEL